MSDTILDNARLQQAASFPVVESEALNGLYRQIQNLMNRISINRRFNNFSNLGRKVIINRLSKNPYIEEIAEIIDKVMQNFKLKKITNDDLKKWKIKPYDIGDGVESPTGVDGVRLDNIQDADFARHFFTNYDDLSRMFMKNVDDWYKNKKSIDENYIRYIPAFEKLDKYGNLRKAPDVMMINNNGMPINVHNLFREYYNRKMNGIFPTFKKASNTSIEDSIENLEL